MKKMTTHKQASKANMPKSSGPTASAGAKSNLTGMKKIANKAPVHKSPKKAK